MKRIRFFLEAAFADRQIYIRSRGNVTFVPISSRSQIILFCLFLLLAAWVGMASINTLFRSQIAEQREREFQEMQLSYENELSRLRLAHDDLNAQLVLTRDWFGETTSKLEKRHDELSDVLERNATISDDLRSMQKSFARVAAKRKSSTSKTELVGRLENPVHTALESRSGHRGNENDIVELTSLNNTHRHSDIVDALPHLPNDLYRRINTLETRQQDLLDALEENVDLKINEFESLIADTGTVDSKTFMARVLPESERAIGGPYIPLKSETEQQDNLNRQIYRISANLTRLSGLHKSLANIPLARPIHDFRITSDFGARLDPFKKRVAFHSGLDFGTANGTPIHATLPGIISQAGYKGPYGLVIEIDHGNGFRTRYGHLARARVRVGQPVEFQQHIGDAGNSGRSTGPHLHYEIWFDGQVRDPRPFIDAGRQIFNVAKTITPINDSN